MEPIKIDIAIDSWQANTVIGNLKKKIENETIRAKLLVDISTAQIKLKELQALYKNAIWQNKIKIWVDILEAQSKISILRWKLREIDWTSFTQKLTQSFAGFWKSLLTNIINPIAIASTAILWFWRLIKKTFSEWQDAFVNYQQQISNISTIVEWDMTWISNQLLEISKRVPKSIWDLADWLYDVYSAWIKTEDAMIVLEQSAMLASAGLGTTKEAVDLMTSALNAFSKQWYTAEQIATTFFIATRNGKTTVAELAQWFWWLAWLAATLWVDFQELIAATAAMTTTGLSAGQAYTGIQWILAAVAKQTKQSTDTAKSLWIEFNATWLATKWFVWFLEDINLKLKEHWIEWPKAAEVMSNLFGRVEWLNTVLSLWWANLEAFNKALSDIKENDINVFLEAFDKQNNTVNARLIKLNNTLETEKIRLWEATSAFAWFWIYLKTQFVNVIRSVSSTVWILFRWVVLWFVATFETFWVLLNKFIWLANKVTSWINKILPKNMQIWQIWQINADFSWTKKQVDIIKDKFQKAFWEEWEITAEAVNIRNKVVEDLSKKTEDTNNSLSNSLWSGWVKWKVDDLKQTFKDTFDSIDKDIDWSKKKIDDYSESIEELSWQLDDLQSDIASRVLEIDQALSATWEDAVVWDERAKLEAERSEAFVWLTEAEAQALRDKIAEQDAYNKLSDIWKLKADFFEETWFTQEQAEAELEIRKEQLKSEEELYKQLNDAKILLEKQYTDKFKEFINEQNIAVKELENQIYSTVWLIKSAQWTVSSISNVNNTTNKNTTIWTVVITKPTSTLWDNLTQ